MLGNSDNPIIKGTSGNGIVTAGVLVAVYWRIDGGGATLSDGFLSSAWCLCGY